MESLKEPSEVTAPDGLMAEPGTESNRVLKRVAVMALLLVLVAAFAGLIPRWQKQAALEKASRESATLLVSVVLPAASQPVADLTLPAEVRPFLEAPIYSRATGYIRQWLVDIGSEVKEGQLLAEIDTPELDQELVQAKAQLFMAESAVPLAKATSARWAELVKTQSVSEQEAAEKASELKLRLAAVDVSKANVARLEQMQNFKHVKAPFDGTITARNIDAGQLVTAGSIREMFRLTQTKKLRVFVRVPQSIALVVTIGQVAQLTIPELPGRSFEGKVVRTSGALTTDSRTLLVEVEVENPKGEILAGTYAQVRFLQVASGQLLSLPANTLLLRPEGTQVGIVGQDGKVEMRTIVLGRDYGPTVEVISGLSTNDRVVLNPPDSLVSGVAVQVAEGKSGL